MNTAIKNQTLGEQIDTLRKVVTQFSNEKKDLMQSIADNGYTFFKKLTPQQTEKLNECEITIDEYYYLVHFDVEAYYNKSIFENDFTVTICQVAKCHIKLEDEYKVVEKLHCNDLSKIQDAVETYWNKWMPDNFFDELGENTDCPVNDDTKIY